MKQIFDMAMSAPKFDPLLWCNGAFTDFARYKDEPRNLLYDPQNCARRAAEIVLGQTLPGSEFVRHSLQVTDAWLAEQRGRTVMFDAEVLKYPGLYDACRHFRHFAPGIKATTFGVLPSIDHHPDGLWWEMLNKDVVYAKERLEPLVKYVRPYLDCIDLPDLATYYPAIDVNKGDIAEAWLLLFARWKRLISAVKYYFPRIPLACTFWPGMLLFGWEGREDGSVRMGEAEATKAAKILAGMDAIFLFDFRDDDRPSLGQLAA